MTFNQTDQSRRIFEAAKRLFTEGVGAIEAGRLEVAEQRLQECLALVPGRESTRQNLAVTYTLRADSFATKGGFTDAIAYYDKAVDMAPNYAMAWFNRGMALCEIHRHQEALDSFNRGLAADPLVAEAWLNQGVVLSELGRHDEALASLDQATHLMPTSAEAWLNRGVSLKNLGRLEEALASVNRAIELSPDLPHAYVNHGVILSEAGRFKEALSSLDFAIDLNPSLFEAWLNRGVVLKNLRRYEDSLRCIVRAGELKPESSLRLMNQGAVLNDLGRSEDALEFLHRAIEIEPLSAEAWLNLGVAQERLNDTENALTSFDRAIRLKSDYHQAWTNRGMLLSDLGQHEDALVSLDEAISIKPESAHAWLARGSLLARLNRYQESLASYERSISCDGSIDFALSDLVHTQMKICDWTELDSRRNRLKDQIEAGSVLCTPFVALGLFDDPELQLKCAEMYSQRRLNHAKTSIVSRAPRKPGKVRIAYFSMDFRDHPVGHLVLDLMIFHDRSTFEVYGFSFGGSSDDPLQRRLFSSFDRFFDVSKLTDQEIARLAHSESIDIAVDLGGYTKNSRPGIFQNRAAPIQISYLGFPGTTGNMFMDYVIGDGIVAPESNRNYFSEKIITLPTSFQVNPRQREAQEGIVTRAQFGLPEDVFVFCCFNNTWKINPEMLRRWASILKRAPNSILWLVAEENVTASNIKNHFEVCGIDQRRIVVTGKVPREAYLLQYKCADLFLDTAPYNAGATASDALSMRLPVLTLKGKSFAANMAASLLDALQLPELIVQTEKDYENIALDLAMNPQNIAALKRKVESACVETSLFKPWIFTKNIENAYLRAQELQNLGAKVDHIKI